MNKNIFLSPSAWSPLVWCLLAYLVAVVVRVLMTDFSSPLREDEYVYLLKAVEITNGNFVPILSHAIGVSLITAPLFLVASLFDLTMSSDVMGVMEYARWIGIVASASGVFPMYFIAREIGFSRQLAGTAAFLFAFYPSMAVSGGGFSSEALFIPVGMWVLLFFQKAARLGVQDIKEAFRYYAIGFLLAGISYWIRPNGVFFFGIGCVVMFIMFFRARAYIFSLPQKTKILYCVFTIVCVGVFWISAAPSLFLRAHHLGSAFTYGENSKYFVDGYEQVWSDTDKAPSATEYISAHSVGEVAKRFVIDGFGKATFALFHDSLPWRYGVLLPVYIPFLLMGLWSYWSRWKEERSLDPSLGVLLVTTLLWLGGLSIIYDVFPFSRHLWMLIPILLLISVDGMRLLGNARMHSAIVASFLLFSLISLFAYKEKFTPLHIPDWAVWSAQHLQGKVAVVEGGDLIMMQLPDTYIGGKNQFDLIAPHTGLSVMRPGNLKDASLARQYFLDRSVTHVVVDDFVAGSARPYIADIGKGNFIKGYEQVYGSPATSTWPARIFRVVP